MSETVFQSMRENVDKIRETMYRAAEQAGRNPEDILLCAACKTRTIEEVKFSAGLDIDLFGENHAQELTEKYDAGAYLKKPSHFIGHLQTNKVKKVVGRASLIQSVDSPRLLAAVSSEAEKRGITQDILLEVNIGGEDSKSGTTSEELWSLADNAAGTSNVRVRGLMAIPPMSDSETVMRGYFADMRHLFEKLRERYPDFPADTLSMGMSHDYPWAIAEGSTMVRIGSAIYGPRVYR